MVEEKRKYFIKYKYSDKEGLTHLELEDCDIVQLTWEELEKSIIVNILNDLKVNRNVKSLSFITRL